MLEALTPSSFRMTGVIVLHLFLITTCFWVAWKVPALRLAGAVCGAFYLLGLIIEYWVFKHPPGVTDSDYERFHVNYYATFAILDTLWLMALLWLRKYWAVPVQILFILISVAIKNDRTSVFYDWDQQTFAGLNLIFLFLVFYGDHISHYLRWIWRKM